MSKEKQSGIYDTLAKNNYDKAYDNVELALKQIQAYLAEKPTNIDGGKLKIIAGLGKEVGQAAIGLEQRVIALERAGFFGK